MTVTALGPNATTREIVERVNVLGRARNLARHSQTVANLPAQVAFGMRTFVTDANATHAAGVGTVVVGGGANTVPIYYDGSDWRIG